MITTLSLLLQQVQDIEHRVSGIYSSTQVTLTKWENRLLAPIQVNCLGYGEDLNHAYKGEDQWVSLILTFEIIGQIDPTPICDYFNSPYIFIWTSTSQKEDDMFITELTIVIC